jgi:SAM-dependent methyltransferase
MLDYDSLDEFRDPLTYDVVCGDNEEELPLIERWAGPPGGSLLDLACGTGRTTVSLAARGYQITGVDLMPEMIARAREKADARSLAIEWLVADARAFSLGKRFRCAYIIGNAFQLFHTREDQEALLARVREHLLPDGHFIIETRNPSRYNLSVFSEPVPRRFTTPDGGELVITDDAPVYDSMAQMQRLTAQYRWLLPGGRQAEKTRRIALRYVYPQEMEALLHYNGFRVLARYGSWQQEPLIADSREMIYVCQSRA